MAKMRMNKWKVSLIFALCLLLGSGFFIWSCNNHNQSAEQTTPNQTQEQVIPSQTRGNEEAYNEGFLQGYSKAKAEIIEIYNPATIVVGKKERHEVCHLMIPAVATLHPKDTIVVYGSGFFKGGRVEIFLACHKLGEAEISNCSTFVFEAQVPFLESDSEILSVEAVVGDEVYATYPVLYRR